MFRANVFLCILFCTFLTSLTSAAGPWDVIVIPDSPSMGLTWMDPQNMAHVLSGDYIIWPDSMAGIKLFNGAKTITLSCNTMAAPMISGTNAAWRDTTSGRIYFWNGQYIRVVPRLHAGPSSMGGNVCLSDSNVAWTDDDGTGFYQIFLWNGTSTIQVSSGTGVGSMCYPQVSGSNVVWKEYDPDMACDRIYLWNGTQRIQVASGMLDPMWPPQVSGSNVAWKQMNPDTGCEQVLFWNGTSVTQVVSYCEPIYSVQLSGNNVVWKTMNSIFHWSGGNVTQVAVGDIYGLEVSGSNVAWTQHDVETMVHKVYLWDGQTTTQISDKNTSGDMLTLMGISDKNVAWYAQGSIFLARYIGTPGN